MDIKEILHFADDLVFNYTGKHLDNTQQLIIEGVWQNKSYQEIANECHLSESRVRNLGSQLLQILSESLGEDINKNNFTWNIKRIANNKFVSVGNNNINYCPNNTRKSSKNKRKSITNKKYHNLTLAPQIIKFCDRETELKTLSHWVENQNIPLISVLGLSGIGKTALVRKFVDLNLETFEVIIWKTLKFPQYLLDSLINDLLTTCQQEIKDTLQSNFKQLFDVFTQKRCLIILDDVQNLFIRGELAGKYKAEYQDYQKFFKMITETNHQSNIILISQEKCTEMESLDEELYPIKSLELSGLFEVKLVKNWGLKDEDSWDDLINLYEGNLFYIKSIAMLINNNYDGEVEEFLTENSLLITNQMQCHFKDIVNSLLSSPEQEIVLQLAKSELPTTRNDLRESLNLSSVDFNNGLQSLQNRYLVKKIKEDKIRFKLFAVFREYVINCY